MPDALPALPRVAASLPGAASSSDASFVRILLRSARLSFGSTELASRGGRGNGEAHKFSREPPASATRALAGGSRLRTGFITRSRRLQPAVIPQAEACGYGL